MILLAALAGLRAQEISRVRGEDFDPSGLLWVRGKGDVTASIPLHPMLLGQVVEMPREGWWFPSPSGGCVHRQAVVQAVGRALRRAGVEATCHQLRHWYGTSLLDAGADLRTTQVLMRHASVATTQRYTQVREKKRVEAVYRLDPFYGEAAAA